MSGERTHGKRSTYVNYGCRCEECREANAVYQVGANQRRKMRRLLGDVDATHGMSSTYDNYKCRCSECVAAKSARNAEAYQKRKAASS